MSAVYYEHANNEEAILMTSIINCVAAQPADVLVHQTNQMLVASNNGSSSRSSSNSSSSSMRTQQQKQQQEGDDNDDLQALKEEEEEDDDDDDITRTPLPTTTTAAAAASSSTSSTPSTPIQQEQGQIKKKLSLTDLAQLCLNDEDIKQKEQEMLGSSNNNNIVEDHDEAGITCIPKQQQEEQEENNNTNSCLYDLDQIRQTITYDGWHDDVVQAQTLLNEYPTSDRFYEKITAMSNKQRLLVRKDRSHPDLQQLDALDFTYGGWKDDHRDYVQRHIGDCSRFQLGISCAFILQKMKKRQLLYEHRSTIDCIKSLDDAIASNAFTYEGWQKDVVLAEGYYTDFTHTDKFHEKVIAMHHKQQLTVHNNRTHHPDIIALDSMEWNYPGYQKDKQEVEKRHIGDCTVLQLGTAKWILQKMKKNQALYDPSVLLQQSQPRRQQPQVQQQQQQEEEEISLTSATSTAATTSSNHSSSGTLGDLDVAMTNNTANEVRSSFNGLLGAVPLDNGDDDDEGYSFSYFGTRSLPTSTTTATIAATTTTSADKTCVVCMEDVPCYAFIPCGHLCLCPGCVDLYECRQQSQHLQQQQQSNNDDDADENTTTNTNIGDEEEPQLKCPICRKSAVIVTRIFT